MTMANDDDVVVVVPLVVVECAACILLVQYQQPQHLSQWLIDAFRVTVAVGLVVFLWQ